MPPEDQSAWGHVARLLRDRRIELGARYKNKRLFSDERQLNRRMLWLAESGRPAKFEFETRRAIESAYGLAPGSFDRMLDGGDLEPSAANPAAAPAGPPPLSFPGADPADSAAAARVFPGDRAAQALLLGGDVQGLADWLDYRRDVAANGYPQDRPEPRDGTAGLAGAIAGAIAAIPLNSRRVT
jgi:hypothetical protein